MAVETSSMPRAIDGLMAMSVAVAVPGGLLDGVTVVDGPSTVAPSDERLLYIGDSPLTGGVGALGSQRFATLPGRERDETYSIFCTAGARSGDTAMKAMRDSAFAVMAAVEQLVRPGYPGGDVTLRGAVSWCSVTGRIVYSPAQTPNGAVVRLTFEIECRARLSTS